MKLHKQKAEQKPLDRSNKFKKLIYDLKTGWQLYIMALPAMLLLFLFAYLPMGGLVIAFKNFNFRKGIFGSDWMDPWYKNFKIIFDHNDAATSAIRNTLILNFIFIVGGTIFALSLALAFNEITHKFFKKLTQSLTFLPYFISTVVVGIFVSGIFGYDHGTINSLLVNLGFDKVEFYMKPSYWPVILLIVNIWKGAGYSAVVYLATISGIDSSYYEAAQIDGASRWQQMWYISLPLLRPTVIILTLLAIGRIMNADFGLFYNVTGDMPVLYSATDVLDTYIYRALRMTGDIGISSATGFFQSVVSFVLVITSNAIVRRYEKDAALF
ncbi:MAG: sugar transporter permease [Herbinix sp.]|nr:sugar transporter permease [Herbinix sp.]